MSQYYEPLYRFAMTLTRTEADAQDLTQQTFLIWATKGHQLRDTAKAKTWLFTTLHRQFLRARQRLTRFTHEELDDHQLPPVLPECVDRLDSAQVLAALAKVDEVYQAAVALFYLEDYPYKDIAAILEVPVGTIKSRIARGITQLRNILLTAQSPASSADESHALASGFADHAADTRREYRVPSPPASRYADWDFSSTLLPEPCGAS